MKKIIAILGILAVAGCHDDRGYITYGNGHPIAAEADSPYILEYEHEMADLINLDRTLLGMNALILSPGISDVARAHSIHMAWANFESTVNPEGDGPADRAALAGFYFSRYEENISAGSSDPVEVFNNWMMIPAMHDNLHDPFMDRMGVGYEYDSLSTFGTYWTVDFLRD